MSAAMSSSLHEGNCVYRKLKPGRSDGEARRGWGVNESFRSDESDEKSAHPCASAKTELNASQHLRAKSGMPKDSVGGALLQSANVRSSNSTNSVSSGKRR